MPTEATAEATSTTIAGSMGDAGDDGEILIEDGTQRLLEDGTELLIG